MWKLIPIIVISILITVFSDMLSKKDNNLNHYTQKNKFLWILIPIVIGIFVGLRTGYNDTYAYIHTYELTPNEFSFNNMSFDFGDNPGHTILTRLIKSLGISVNGYLMIYSVVTYSIYIWFIHKYSTDFSMSMFLFICLVFEFPMAAMKQCIAVAFCLIAVDKAINKKWFWFIFWLFIAETFHAYSFMYLIVPLLFFVPWESKKTYIWIAMFFFAGLLLKPLLGSLLSITDSLGEEYTVEEFSSGGVNPFRLAVCLVPLALSFLLRKQVTSPDNEMTQEDNICMNLSFLNGELMFVALFGTANYFARLANYFYIFPLISLPRLFNMIKPKWRLPLKIVAIICYFIFFYYEINVVYGHFDDRFRRILLSDFHIFA